MNVLNPNRQLRKSYVSVRLHDYGHNYCNAIQVAWAVGLCCGDGMRFPTFRPDDPLSEWSECFLEIRCGCGRSSHAPVKLLLGELGDITFTSYLSRLRCQECKGLPGPVYFCAGHHRTFCGGSAPDWALEVVADPHWRGAGSAQQKARPSGEWPGFAALGGLVVFILWRRCELRHNVGL